MRIAFDPAKRDRTLSERGLDFAKATEVFSGLTATINDDRKPYPEVRYITAGFLAERLVVVVWTPEGTAVASYR
jgi:hypothetical protein